MINPCATSSQPLPQHAFSLTIGEQRRLWLKRNKVTQVRLAELAGVKPPRISAVLDQKFATEGHIAAMRQVGMPENLLPSLPGHASSGAE